MRRQQEKTKLSIIILNFNTAELLRQCLLSLLREAAYQTIVVDNASTDGSAAMVKKEFPWVTLLESKRNVGYAAGNNLARKFVKGEYMLFLNPDTKIIDGAIEKVLGRMKREPLVGIATAEVKLADGSLYYACHRGFPTPWNSLCYFLGLSKLSPKVRLFSGYTLGYLPLDVAHEIDACSGTFLMVRRELLDKLGWLDRDYYMYGEDIDLCYRVKKLGYKVMFYPEAQIVHYWGAASGLKESSQEVSIASRETKIRSTAARFEAMKIFYDKHYAHEYPRFVRWLIFTAVDIKKAIALIHFNLSIN